MKKQEPTTPFSTRLALFGLLLFWAGPLYAAFFYVSPTGNDNNPGTVERPWRTITQANRTLRPGDTVFIREGEYRGQRIEPVNSGTAGNYITYSAFGDDTPVITEPPRAPPWNNLRIAILLVNRDYIRITGLTVDGQGHFLNSNIDRWAFLRSADNNIIEDSTFRRARGFHGVLLIDSNRNQILGNDMDEVGEYDRGAGELVALNCSDNNLVQGNNLSRGGHDLLVSNGNMNILRQNVLNNRWGPNQGYRAVTLSSNRRFCDRAVGYNVLERNTIMNVLITFDLRESVATKAEGTGQILRNNVWTNNLDRTISSALRPPIIQEARLSRIYNNTLYRSGSLWRINDFGNPAPANNNGFKNNAVVLRSADDEELFISLEAHPTPLENNFFIANSFAREGGGAQRFVIRGIGTVTLDFLQTNFPRLFSDNIIAFPDFVSVEPLSPNAFRPAPTSPLIDRGAILTRTRSAGSGRSVPVVDAGYFSDGSGMVEGDRVRIGGSAPVELTDVNYGANTLTLASSRSWSNGAPVNLPFEGSAPDIGAFEFGAGGEPSNVTCNDLTPTIIGTAGDETIPGTAGPDVIAGLGGADQIRGLEGDDTICGGNGDDIIGGGPGNDTLSGDGGNDRMLGGNDDDRVDGGDGADELFGNDGSDALLGGADNDTCDGGEPTGGDSADSAIDCEEVIGVP